MAHWRSVLGLLALCLLLGGPVPSGAARGAALPPGAGSLSLAGHIEYLADPGGELTFAEVRSGAHAQRFRPWEGPGAFNAGYSEAVYWLRFPLAARDGPRRLLLEAGYFSLEALTLFTPDGARIAGGLGAERDDRLWPHRHPVFVVEPGPRPAFYYLRLHSRGSLTLPLTLWTPEAFAAKTQRDYFLQTLYFGGLLGLVLFNFLLFLSLRDGRYLLYVLYGSFLGVGLLALQGLGGQFLWPSTVAWSTLTSNVAFSLATLFGLLFARRFLDTRRFTPRLHLVLGLLAALFAANALLPALGETARLSSLVLSLLAPAAAVLTLAVAVLTFRRGSRGARFFLLAWGVLLATAVAAGLRNLGWVPTTAVTANILPVGSAVEMVLLALALADRINQERAARSAAQTEALAAKRELVDTLAASERRLEQQVAQRTRALRQALEQEQAVLKQYVRFGSFLSHELRNPLAIIQNQAALARKEAERGHTDPTRRLASVASAASRLQVLVDEWLASDRLRQPGIDPDPKALALAPWLAEWVPLAAAGHPEHTVTLAAGDDDATVQADEALLRIVLFNLVDNACKYSPVGAAVTVRLAHGEAAGFAVADAGPGMDTAEQGRIFEAYSRSAGDEGETGLGLGLPLVKRIVTLHGGTLTVASRPGAGSRFTVWLPRADDGANIAEAST